MIQMQTVLQPADNSGAKKLQCIKVLGGSKRKYASVGDIIVVSVREAMPKAKVKKIAEKIVSGSPSKGKTASPPRIGRLLGSRLMKAMRGLRKTQPINSVMRAKATKSP